VSKVASRGRLLAHIVTNLLEDVDKRWRKGYAVVHGEAESMRLSVAMVGILTNDYHVGLVEGAKVEGVENQFARRKNGVLAVLGTNKVGELDEVVLLKLTAKMSFPALFKLYVHLLIYIVMYGCFLFCFSVR
jgi:hypothetical protein